jgi:uncharacterized protein (TIGR02284 family)
MSTINTPIPSTLLRPETIDSANELIRLNIDSAKGWTAAAEGTEDSSLRGRFFEFARVRDTAAAELQTLIRAAGDVPPEAGTAQGSVHRWWMNIKARITGSDVHAILVEAERGEDAIKHAYEQILSEPISPELSGIVSRQYTQVRAIHDEVKALRDAPELK